VNQRGSRVQTAPLTAHSVAAIVNRYAELAGLDPSQFTVRGYVRRVVQG
jgi:hypothetical protein